MFDGRNYRQSFELIGVVSRFSGSCFADTWSWL